jgi:hypothetical protein
MANERIASVKLRFETDKAAFANVRANTQALQQELSKLDRQRAMSQVAADTAKFAAEGGNARVAVARLNAEMTKLDANAAEVRQVAREFDRLRDSAEKAAAAANNTGRGGKKSNAITTIGREIRALPAVPISGNLSTDVFGKLIAIMGGLNPVVLGVIVTLGGLIVGLNRLAAEGGKAIQSIINSQEEYFRALKTGTSESIQAAIDTKRIEVDILRARVDEYQRLFSQFEAEAGGVGRAIADALNIGNVGTLRKELQDLEAKLRDEEFALSRLNNALGDTEIATRDATAAQEAMTKQLQSIMDLTIDAGVQARLAASTLDSTKALDERIEALRNEQDILETQIKLGTVSDEQSEKYQQRIYQIIGAIEALNTITRYEVEQRERERHAIEAATKARERNVAQQEALAKAQDDAAKATDSFNASLEKIASDARNKLADAARDREKALVDAEIDAQKARAEASRDRETSIIEVARKAGIDREKQEREHLKRLTEINRRFQIDEATAIQDRDSVALDTARRTRDEAVQSETDNYAEQRAEVDRNLQEQTRTISMRYAEQAASINARLNEQTAAINARYTEQVQQIYAAANAARQAEITSYQQRLASLARFVQQEVGIEAQRAAAMLGVQQQYWQAALSMASSALQSIRATQAQGTQFRGNTQTLTRSTQALARGNVRGMVSFDTGGYITRTGAAMVHEGEYIMNPRRGQYPVNFAPTVNMSGQGGAEQIRAVLMQEVDRFVGQLERGMM